MSIVGHAYTLFGKSLARGLVDLVNDDLRVMLLSAYTVGTTRDDAQFLSDVLSVATETSGTGYTANGKAIVSPALSSAGHVETLDTGTDVSWATATFDAAYAVLYDRTPGSNATRPVIGYYDLGGTQSVSGGTFLLTINASGLLTITAS